MRAFISGGAKLNEIDRQRVQNIHGIPVVDAFGSTEILGVMFAEPFTVGKLIAGPSLQELPGVEVFAVEQGKEVNEIKVGQSFQLGYRSQSLFFGYLGGPIRRVESFISEDLVVKNEHGFYEMIGRSSNSFKGKNQEWVYPDLLEKWLQKRPMIKDAVVKVIQDNQNSEMNSLEIFVEGDFENIEHFEQWQFRLNQEIKAEMGIEYTQIHAVYSSQIQRNHFGKLQNYQIDNSFRNLLDNLQDNLQDNLRDNLQDKLY